MEKDINLTDVDYLVYDHIKMRDKKGASITPKEICEKLEKSPQSISRCLKKLRDSGKVVAVKVAGDKRVVNYSIK
jgi:DNA-binding MarR family transcriptional regulator